MQNSPYTRKKYFVSLLLIILLISFRSADAQYLWNSDSAFKTNSPNSGRLWGYVFGDYYFKEEADTLKRGSGTQYSGIPKDMNAFQIRRLYLGYNYNITKKFAAEVLLEAAPGEGLTDNKLAFYVKLANLRIKNLWKGTDLVVGQVTTPGFAMSSEPLWGYRSIEKTLIDIRGTPSYDLGATLQGKFDPETANFGYDFMLGNGTGAKPEGDKYKWFYADVWGKFFDKKLYANLYVDYNRLGRIDGLPHSRNMIKGFIAYTVPKITIGVEGYINNLKNDNLATEISTGNVDVLSVQAKGISLFIHGIIVKDKLNFFARYDAINPSNKIDNSKYNIYVGNTGGFNDPSTKEQFITAGLDFTPIKNVHLMPNVWYNKYINQGFTPKYNAYDMAWRITSYFVFGK